MGLLNEFQDQQRGLLAEQELRAMPRNGLLGLLAEALGGLEGFAKKPISAKGGLRSPQLAATADFLGLGPLARTVDRMSYGEPLTTGRGMTTAMRPDTADALMSVGPAVAKWPKQAAGAMGGLLGMADTGAAKAAMLGGLQNSSRTAKMRAPQQVNEVGFWDEYKGIKPGAASGERPMADIDGRAIDPRAAIAGRATVDGDSVGLTNEQLDAIIQQLGIGIRGVPAREIGGDAGRFVVNGGDRSILLARDLDADQVPHVMRHEVGHAVDYWAGGFNPGGRFSIAPDGHSKALAHIYDDLNNRMGPSLVGVTRQPKKQHTPAVDRYNEDEYAGERMAEAIRAYITNPAYIKTVAPALAARLRKAVNENSNLRKILVLNSAAGAAVLGAPYAGDGTD